tara:strand:+ start:204 stop:386 length:183 start_codon:yes stop_codon:yes gene_type:complete
MLEENKIVEETVDTVIDNIYDKLEEYMYEYGNYTESDNRFVGDREEYMLDVIKELYNRIK